MCEKDKDWLRSSLTDCCFLDFGAIGFWVCLLPASLPRFQLSYIRKNCSLGDSVRLLFSPLLFSGLIMFDRQDQGQVNIPLDFSQTERLLFSHWMTKMLSKPWQWGSVILQMRASMTLSRSLSRARSVSFSLRSWSAASGRAVRKKVMSSQTCPEM